MVAPCLIEMLPALRVQLGHREIPAPETEGTAAPLIDQASPSQRELPELPRHHSRPWSAPTLPELRGYSARPVRRQQRAPKLVDGRMLGLAGQGETLLELPDD